MGRNRKGLVTAEGRECSKCGQFQTWNHFSPAPLGVMGHSPRCHRCLNGEQNRKVSIARHYADKELVFNHYGAVCKECGETNKKKLQIDHINEDGRQHRAEEINAKNLAYWIVRAGFPDGFQILCRSCNFRKAGRARRERNSHLFMFLLILVTTAIDSTQER